MAEHAAHLTSVGLDTKPSIFEVLAQDSLMSTIRPALKHAVKVLVESRPDKFTWLLQYYDEIYTVFDFILQNYYLKFYNASFAENFYGLKRVPLKGPPLKDLPKRIHWKSLICLVFLPYIKQKLDKLFEDSRYAVNSGQCSQKNLLGQLYRAFVSIYPYVHTVWEGSVLWYQMAYMFGKSNWHSPFVKLSEVELRNLEASDLEDKTLSSSTSWDQASGSQKVKILLKKGLNITAVTLSTSLSHNTDITTAPLGVCPVCMKTRTNDTALSISGYVFCYTCIREYIQQHKCCPVTNYPASSDHLVKLYPPDS
ncbi:hypothetical protein KUTeg_010437 [Tegillarca granosa]|uniref:Peroxisome assembly protein 12 n=1 Tax=Tegillarca granosa TaxID=220873 RepID=A0ABQ9F6W5_TEGGR|nr:hypothetical protein KUTeg_010437 [Tegillarca granosa]